MKDKIRKSQPPLTEEQVSYGGGTILYDNFNNIVYDLTNADPDKKPPIEDADWEEVKPPQLPPARNA